MNFKNLLDDVSLPEKTGGIMDFIARGWKEMLSREKQKCFYSNCDGEGTHKVGDNHIICEEHYGVLKLKDL